MVKKIVLKENSDAVNYCEIVTTPIEYMALVTALRTYYDKGLYNKHDGHIIKNMIDVLMEFN